MSTTTKKHHISIRLFPRNEGAKEKLKALAEQKDMSLNKLMNVLIENALETVQAKEAANPGGDPY